MEGLDPPADTPARGSLGDPSAIQFQSITPRISYLVASMMLFVNKVMTTVFIWVRGLSFLLNRRGTLGAARLKVRVFILQLLVQSDGSGDMVPYCRAGPPCGNHLQSQEYGLPP